MENNGAASPQILVSCLSSRELNVGLETWLQSGVHNAKSRSMGFDIDKHH